MESPPAFAEEIDFIDLHFQEVVGRGAFGIVSRARWRNKDVAVKVMETESEKRAFILELKSLSRVNHQNIVKLYGACTSTRNPICLVMEYAEGGSLYNVLHGNGPQPTYTSAHAMSWTLQCARGVDYLHTMKPKAIIHRDLKPPNLLLILGGTVLKICDFGTACDMQTHMTNNKGSAAWMAPEVFEGCNYSEKCDIFSWGIILWEVSTRKKPFDEIGGPAFRIMWAVHNGTRPPLVQGMPKPLEELMTSCWSAAPQERPSMSEIVRVMETMTQFFGTECNERLVYPETQDDQQSIYDTPPPTHPGVEVTYRDTIREALKKGTGEVVPIVLPPDRPPVAAVVVEDDDLRRSAPASLAASRESLVDDKSPRSAGGPPADFKRYSADLTKLDEKDYLQRDDLPVQSKPKVSGHRMGHRRSISHGTVRIITDCHDKPVPCHNVTGAMPQTNTAMGHRRTGSHGNSPLVTSGNHIPHVSTVPCDLSSKDLSDLNVPLRSVSWTPGQDNASMDQLAGSVGVIDRRHSHGDEPKTPTLIKPAVMGPNSPNDAILHSNAAFAANFALAAMDHHLQPLAPYPASSESMAIFHEHCRVAQEYMKVNTEIALLNQKKHDLTQELNRGEQDQQNSDRYVSEFTQLTNENESLSLLLTNMKKQVEHMKQQRQKNDTGS